jgi:hypothetical protein
MKKRVGKRKKTVKLTVWTSDLAGLSMTPVTREYANEHASDDDLEHLKVEEGVPSNFYFCNNGCEEGAVCLTIEDGGNEQEFETLPIVDFGEMDQVKDEEEKNGEFANEAAVRKSFYDEDSYVVAWKTLKALRSGPLSALAEHCVYSDYIQKEVKLADQYSESGGDGVFFVQFGSLGKDRVHFEIDLPEGEEFDIGKLHFFNCGEWWVDISDRQFLGSNLDSSLRNAFEGKDVLLDYVEYDGRFFERIDADMYFWQFIFGSVFLDDALIELEGE